MWEGLGGWRGGANFGRFLQLFCGARGIFRRWLLGFFSGSPFWVSVGRFSGVLPEVHEGIWGRFWAFQEAHEAFGGCFGRVLSSAYDGSERGRRSM